MSDPGRVRVWVTGIGVVSPLGRGARVTMDALVSGDRAIGPLTLFSLPGSRVDIAAEVRDLDVAGIAPKGAAGGWSRTDAMALLALSEALSEARVDPRAAQVDLAVGGSTTGMFENELVLAEMSREGAAIRPVSSVLSHPLSSTADRLVESVGPFRRTRSICSACSSGANAILVAATWIRLGLSTCVVAGGSDGLCRLTFAGFGSLSALSREPCRPFDRRRSGLNLGEGAAFLVLEAAERARSRGAVPLAELSGYALGAEAHHITNPESSGATAARVMAEALRMANVSPADLDYINAHGTATPLNDAMEAAAIRSCLGAEADRVAVSSTKGHIGHTLAAAGAIEAAITVMAIARGIAPPTAGLEEIDPACPLAHVTSPKRGVIRAAMSNSFGFGGTDTALVFAEPERFAPAATERRRVVITGSSTLGAKGVLGTVGSLAYLDADAEPSAKLSISPADYLDVARARRVDRAGRFITVAVQRALVDAGIESALEDVGAIVGTAFASVDASTVFMARLLDKGANFASPADFPNLVPSSPIGHASIYLGLRGVVLTAADLGATAESAVATAVELCAAGITGAIAAGSFEEASQMIEHCIGPANSGSRGARGEGGAIVVVETEERARARGAAASVEVVFWRALRGEDPELLEGAPPPEGRAGVFVGREEPKVAALLETTAWREAPRRALAELVGDNEGAGGFALVAAVAELQRGSLDSALVVGHAKDRTVAFVLLPRVRT